MLIEKLGIPERKIGRITSYYLASPGITFQVPDQGIPSGQQHRITGMACEERVNHRRLGLGMNIDQRTHQLQGICG